MVPPNDGVPTNGQSTAGGLPAADAHRWISLHDQQGDTWMFDVTFLLSNFHCIYGQGCPSIADDPESLPIGRAEALGCCVHGAHFADDEDLENTAAYAALLTDDDWQYRRRAIKKGGAFKKNAEGAWVTRRVDGACIFLNREQHPGGAGCALHSKALQLGQRPLDWKPDVCWQVPIRLDIHTDDYGHDTVFVRAWERRDWGEGGFDFHWWCSEEPSAYSNNEPLFESAADELIELVGEAIYEKLVIEMHSLLRETPVQLGRR